MEINGESRVGEIATEHPLTARVFGRHGIDYCCGGQVPLHEACEKHNIHVLR